MAGLEDAAVDEELFEEEAHAPEPEEQDDTNAEAPEGDEAEETVISFGDEELPAGSETETGLVRKLRAELKDRDRRLREVEAARSKPQPIEVGPKPSLESCEYDEERFEQELDAWKVRDAEARRQGEQAERDAQAVQAAFNEDLTRFAAKKAELRVPDFEDAEAEVVNALSREQNAVMIMAADNAAAVMFALGKHPERLKAIAAIKHPIKLAAAIAKLERDLKVTTRKRAPEPEGIVRGSAPLSARTDKHLERLQAEASRTGDRTKVIAYQREQKRKAGG